MINGLMCFLGFHDWHCLAFEDRYAVAWKVRFPGSNVPPPVSCGDTLYDRVCLNCGLRDNQIENHRRDTAMRESENECRHAKAIAMIDSAG